METAVLVALIGSIGGTLGAQIVSGVLTNKREDERRKHEQALKQMELGDARLERRREERIQAYRNLAMLTVTINLAEPYRMGDLAEAYSEIQLVADSSEVKEAAREVYEAASEARKLAGRTKLAGNDPESDTETRAAIESAVDRRAAFMKVANEDLDPKR
jgi:hypothetical protein